MSFTDQALKAAEPKPHPFKFIESCSKPNKFKKVTCKITEKANNFDKIAIFVYDIMPELFRELASYAWTRRVFADFDKKISGPLLEFPKEANRDFFQNLKNPTGKKSPEVFKKGKFSWGGKKRMLDRNEEKSFESGLNHWDLLLLKNFLLNFYVGSDKTKPRPLICFNPEETEDSKEFKEREEKLIKLVKFRNAVAHSNDGFSVSKETYKDFMKTFLEFKRIFFGKPVFKELNDNLEKKIAMLENATFQAQLNV